MRIVIEFDATTAGAKVTYEESAVTRTISEPVAQGALLDAGACSAPSQEVRASVMAPRSVSAPRPITAGPPPPPHRDTFGLHINGERIEGGMDAGAFRG